MFDAARDQEFKHDDDNGAAAAEPMAVEEWEGGGELPPVRGLHKKYDHTDDKIDWELLKEEDLKTADRLTAQYGLGEDFADDAKWCACVLKSRLAATANHPFHRINDYIAENIGSMSVLQLVTSIQDMYIQVWKKVDLKAQMRFWFRRSIYDHLYDHAITHYTRRLLELGRVDKMKTRIFQQYVFSFDHALGEEICDDKKIASFEKLSKLSESVMKAIESDKKHLSAVRFL